MVCLRIDLKGVSISATGVTV